MSVKDFLFEGKAPDPVTLTGTSTVQLPEWYTSYVTDMLGKAKGISEIPYATYPGPRIAPFTETEKKGFESTKEAAFGYKPFLQKATGALDQSAGITGMGAAAGDFARAGSMMGAAAAQPYFSKAGDMSSMGAASPYFAEGKSAIQKAGAGSALAAAQPYISQAAKTFPGAAQEYMSPYIKGVVEQIGDIGIRQLKEKYLPEIGQEFIGAGQFSVGPGSTRMGEFSSRALRDVQQSILGEQSKALQAGYGQAADIYGRDVSRIAELAGLTGKLSADDYARLLESGVRTADIGAKAGQLTSEDAARMIDIGKATGTLTQQDADNLSRIAESKGRLSLEDAAALRDLSTKYLGMGGAEQELGLKGAEAITGVGAKERAMGQANLELAYQDFLRQEGYPEDRIKFLASVLSGVNIPQTTITTRQELPSEDILSTDASKAANTYKVLDEILKGSSGSSISDLLKKLFGR